MGESIQHNCTAIEAFGPLTMKRPGSLQRCHRYCGSESKMLQKCIDIDRGESRDRDHWAQVSAWYMTAALVVPGNPTDSPLKAEKEKNVKITLTMIARACC